MYQINIVLTVNLLFFLSKPYNCLSSHGRAGLKKKKYPLAVSGLNFAVQGPSGLKKSWTVPSPD